MIDRPAFRGELRRAAAKALAVTAGYAATMDRVAQLAVPALAALCLIDVVENGSLTRRVAVTDGMLGSSPERLEAPHPDVGEGAPAALRAGRPLTYGRGWLDALGKVDPALARYPDLHSVTVLPLMFDRVAIGVITLGKTQPLDDVDVALAQDFAQLAAVAIANARLLEDARAARDLAEGARARLGFVSRAGAILARSFERDEAVDRLLATTIGEFADAALCSVVDADGVTIHRRAGSGDMDALEELALHAMRDARTRVDAGMHVLAVPLLSGGRINGALCFTRAAQRPAFAIDDLTMVEEIATRLALFVETARTFMHQRNIAETLQRAFRPRDLPAIDGLTLASAYQPGTADVEVGGDWYDVLILDADRIAFAIGDVMGHGIEAAAAMAEVRSGLRALLYAGVEPGRCLGFVDTQLAHTAGMRDLFATGVTAIYDRRTRVLSIANAGHPSPYLCRAGGALVEIVGPAALLGLDAGTRKELAHELIPGDVVLFFTDGVVEDRARSYEDGLAALEDVLRTSAGPAEMIDRILAQTVSSSDDRTLLAFCVE